MLIHAYALHQSKTSEVWSRSPALSYLLSSSVLHRGKFGVVFRCLSKKTKDPCAVKVMLKKGNKKADVEREVGVLRKLNHPSVLQVMDYFECDNEYVLVMER